MHRSRGGSRGRQPDGGALWHNFTDSMLAVSRRMPGIGRASAAWQDRRAANREWDEAERGGLWGDDDAGSDAMDDLGGSPLPSELWEQQSSQAQSKRGLLSRRVSYPVLVVLLLLSLFVSFFGTDSVLKLFDALSAARDAKAQVALIEAELKGGDVTSTDHLVYVQTHLTILGQDVTRIQGDIPLEPLVAHAPGGSGITHMLTMAQDLVQAGQSGIDAALLLIPSLKGLLKGIGDSSIGAASAKLPPAITTAQIQQASSDVDSAGALVQAAVQERQQVSDGDLSSVGMGSLVPTLHKLDALTPKLGKYLGAAHTLMAELPTLLGLSKPVNYLLLNMDSDELRATGGFVGNYAVLNVSGGRLQGGVHLRDIRLLDCPPDGSSNCLRNQIPDRFSWFTLAQQYWDVRDSNLDPDFPTSAKLAIDLAQKEGTPPLSGVIAMTPAVIEDILQITGPMQVPQFGVKVTADNLQEQIHYFHVLAAYCQPTSPYASDPRCAQLAGAVDQTGTTGRKAFDAQLGSTLLHTVGSLPPQKQNAVFKVILGAIQTKDLQVYLSDSAMEGVLADLKLNSAIDSPQGDGFMVTDTNVSASYVNGDIQEQIADQVSLDTHGTATHNLTITYKYPVVNHLWSNIYPDAGGFWELKDVVRVMVPQNAKLTSPNGCAAVDAPESGHGVIACEFILGRTDTGCVLTLCGSIPFFQGTGTLHFQWSVPNAAQVSSDGSQYTLLVQKQAGTHSTVSITITPPTQSNIASLSPTPDATPTPGAIAGTVSKGSALFSGQLTKDVTLALSY